MKLLERDSQSVNCSFLSLQIRLASWLSFREKIKSKKAVDTLECEREWFTKQAKVIPPSQLKFSFSKSYMMLNNNIGFMLDSVNLFILFYANILLNL